MAKNGEHHDPEPESVASRMRAARQAAGITQTELGRRIGAKLGRDPISQERISKWERGSAIPLKPYVDAMEVLLGATLGDREFIRPLGPAAVVTPAGMSDDELRAALRSVRDGIDAIIRALVQPA